jgi:hypothetical protein
MAISRIPVSTTHTIKVSAHTLVTSRIKPFPSI